MFGLDGIEFEIIYIYIIVTSGLDWAGLGIIYIYILFIFRLD